MWNLRKLNVLSRTSVFIFTWYNEGNVLYSYKTQSQTFPYLSFRRYLRIGKGENWRELRKLSQAYWPLKSSFAARKWIQRREKGRGGEKWREEQRRKKGGEKRRQGQRREKEGEKREKDREGSQSQQVLHDDNCFHCFRLTYKYGLSRGQKHSRDWKNAFLIRQSRTKRANFRGSPLFQAMSNRKTQKQTINSVYLVSLDTSQLTESVSCSFPSASLPHPTDTR